MCHLDRLFVVVRETWDSLVRHRRQKLDRLGIGFKRDKSVSTVVEQTLLDGRAPDQLVFECSTHLEFLKNLRAGQLKHVVRVEVIWLRLFKSE